MIDLILVIIAYTLYWIIEVFHDDILRVKNNSLLGLMRILSKLKSNYFPDFKDEHDLTSKWHKLDWQGHAILAILVGYLAGNTITSIILYPIMIGALRVLILNIGGNIVSGRNLFYVGERGIESKFKDKKILYYILWLIIFVSSLLSIIFF